MRRKLRPPPRCRGPRGASTIRENRPAPSSRKTRRLVAAPHAGSRSPESIVAKVPGLSSEGASDAVGQVGVAAIKDLREQVGQELHDLRRYPLVLQLVGEFFCRYGQVTDPAAGGAGDLAHRFPEG